MAKLEKLVIDEQRWCVGDPTTSALLTRDNKMCCLGFMGRALGATSEDMLHALYPSEYISAYKEYMNVLAAETDSLDACGPNSWQHVIGLINDASNVTQDERKAWVKEGFKQLFGIDVEFVNGAEVS